MKERPIIFNADMVRAILDGRKTQTRRIVKPQGAILTDDTARSFGVRPPLNQNSPVILCPYGQPGDRLWVRETWAHVQETSYRRSEGVQQTINPKDSDMAAVYAAGWDRSLPGRWRPSIHMPRWASRITLEIKSINVERLQDITEQDAQNDGVELFNNYDGTFGGHAAPMTHKEGFVSLWESINGKDSWDSNPWVWVIKFERIK